MRNFFALLFFLITATGALAQDYRYGEGAVNMPASGSQQTFQIQTATDSIEYYLTAPEDATITKVLFGYEGRLGTPVQQKIGIQGVDTSTGRCNGTYKTGTGECSIAYTPPASSAWDNSVQVQTLTGTTCTVARGERLCIKISPVGTPSGANLSGYIRAMSNTNESDAGEYHYTVSAGTPTIHGDLPVIAFGNSSRWFGYPAYPYNQFDISSSGNTPDEVALKFQYPCASGQTFRVAGLTAFVKIPATGKSLKAVLYSGTTVLQDVTYDTDLFRSAGGTAGIKMIFDESSLTALTCGNSYYLSLQPQDTSMNSYVAGITVGAAAYMDAYPWGANTYYATRTDAGAWTDVTTQRPDIWPIIDKVDAVSSGAGVSNLGKFSGGFQ